MMYVRMRRFQIGLIFTLALGLLVSCDQKEMLRRLIPPDQDLLARNFIKTLKSGKLEDAKTFLDPTLSTPEADKGLRDLADLLNQGVEKSVTVVGVGTHTNFSTKGTSTTCALTYQFESTTTWLLGSVI